MKLSLSLQIIFATVMASFMSLDLFAQKPAPAAESKGTVEFWQRELLGKSKTEVKALLGTPASIAEQGSVYNYPDEFFHPDLDQWRGLVISFDDQDRVESFSGGEDSKIYQLETPVSQATPEGLAEGRQTALEIAEYFKRNRDGFDAYEGRSVEVSGVVDSLRLENSHSAKVYLRTKQGLPQIVLRYDIRVHPKAIDESQLRLRDSGTIEWRVSPDKEESWRPLIAVGRELGAKDVLTSYRINIELSVDSIQENL